MGGWSKEVENGKTTYEASITDHYAKLDVVFAEDGSLVAIEQAIGFSELPAEVKRTLDAKYPHATVAKAEKISDGDEIQYEVQLHTGLSGSELWVALAASHYQRLRRFRPWHCSGDIPPSRRALIRSSKTDADS